MRLKNVLNGTICLIFLLCAIELFGKDIYIADVNGKVAKPGALPNLGYYIIFPELSDGHLIRVENSENGEKVAAIILAGELDEGVDVYISSAAAKALGVANNKTAIVKLYYITDGKESSIVQKIQKIQEKRGLAQPVEQEQKPSESKPKTANPVPIILSKKEESDTQEPLLVDESYIQDIVKKELERQIPQEEQKPLIDENFVHEVVQKEIAKQLDQKEDPKVVIDEDLIQALVTKEVARQVQEIEENLKSQTRDPQISDDYIKELVAKEVSTLTASQEEAPLLNEEFVKEIVLSEIAKELAKEPKADFVDQERVQEIVDGEIAKLLARDEFNQPKLDEEKVEDILAAKLSNYIQKEELPATLDEDDVKQLVASEFSKLPLEQIAAEAAKKEMPPVVEESKIVELIAKEVEDRVAKLENSLSKQDAPVIDEKFIKDIVSSTLAQKSASEYQPKALDERAIQNIIGYEMDKRLGPYGGGYRGYERGSSPMMDEQYLRYIIATEMAKQSGEREPEKKTSRVEENNKQTIDEDFFEKLVAKEVERRLPKEEVSTTPKGYSNIVSDYQDQPYENSLPQSRDLIEELIEKHLASREQAAKPSRPTSDENAVGQIPLPQEKSTNDGFPYYGDLAFPLLEPDSYGSKNSASENFEASDLPLISKEYEAITIPKEPKQSIATQQFVIEDELGDDLFLDEPSVSEEEIELPIPAEEEIQENSSIIEEIIPEVAETINEEPDSNLLPANEEVPIVTETLTETEPGDEVQTVTEETDIVEEPLPEVKQPQEVATITEEIIPEVEAQTDVEPIQEDKTVTEEIITETESLTEVEPDQEVETATEEIVPEAKELTSEEQTSEPLPEISEQEPELILDEYKVSKPVEQEQKPAEEVTTVEEVIAEVEPVIEEVTETEKIILEPEDDADVELVETQVEEPQDKASENVAQETVTVETEPTEVEQPQDEQPVIEETITEVEVQTEVEPVEEEPTQEEVTEIEEITPEVEELSEVEPVEEEPTQEEVAEIAEITPEAEELSEAESETTVETQTETEETVTVVAELTEVELVEEAQTEIEETSTVETKPTEVEQSQDEQPVIEEIITEVEVQTEVESIQEEPTQEEVAEIEEITPEAAQEVVIHIEPKIEIAEDEFEEEIIELEEEIQEFIEEIPSEIKVVEPVATEIKDVAQTVKETKVDKDSKADLKQTIPPGLYYQVGLFSSYQRASEVVFTFPEGFREIVGIYQVEKGYKVLIGALRISEKGLVQRVAARAGFDGFFTAVK